LIALALLALVAGPIPAYAQDTSQLRHAIIFEEHIDGEKQTSSSAETQLMEELLAKGVVFVDEEQARKIRSVTDAGSLIDGKIAEVITSLDADIIIVGIAKATLIAKNVMGQPLVRYDSDIQVKLIAVDNGEIIGAYTIRGEGMDFNAQQAATKASRTAASKLTTKILATLEKRATAPKRVEITVAGTKNVAAVEQIKSAISQLSGISDTKVLQAGKGMTKLSVNIMGTTSGEIAVKLQSLPELGWRSGAIPTGPSRPTFPPPRPWRCRSSSPGSKTRRANGATTGSPGPWPRRPASSWPTASSWCLRTRTSRWRWRRT